MQGKTLVNSEVSKRGWRAEGVEVLPMQEIQASFLRPFPMPPPKEKGNTTLGINFRCILALARRRPPSRQPLFERVRALHEGRGNKLSTSTVAALFSKMALTSQRIAMVDVVFLVFTAFPYIYRRGGWRQSLPLKNFFSCSLGGGGGRYFSVPSH